MGILKEKCLVIASPSTPLRTGSAKQSRIVKMRLLRDKTPRNDKKGQAAGMTVLIFRRVLSPKLRLFRCADTPKHPTGSASFNDKKGQAAGMTVGRRQEGFTLVEVLIAVFITSIALIALASLAGTAIKATEAGRKRTQAANLATQKLEALKKVPYSKIQTTDTSATAGIQRNCGAAVGTPPVFTCTPSAVEAGETLPATNTLGTISFTWRWKVTYVDLDNDTCYFAASPCGAGPVIDSNDIKKVDAEVSWTDLLGSHTLTLTALRAI